MTLALPDLIAKNATLPDRRVPEGLCENRLTGASMAKIEAKLQTMGLYLPAPLKVPGGLTLPVAGSVRPRMGGARWKRSRTSPSN